MKKYVVKLEWWNEYQDDLDKEGDIYIFDELEKAVHFGYQLCFNEETWHGVNCPTDAYLYELDCLNGCGHLSGEHDRFLCSWTQLKYKARD